MHVFEKTLLLKSSGCKFRISRMWLLIVTVLGLVTGNSVETGNKITMNPEASMNISEIIHFWGYPSEEYEVLTKDGYYLSLNRIPGGSKAAILLVHGIVLEGRVWIANPPHESLGFILADAGYDVWIGNVRGTSWSQRHTNFTIEQEEFWNFSFHEMGIYDIPAITDFILQKTGHKKIYYAGHNQGTTIAFVGLSVIPQLAEKIEMFFALGPIYTVQFSISPIVQILRLPPILFEIIFGRSKFSLLSKDSRELLSQTCSYETIDIRCKQAIQLIVTGFNEKNLNESRMDVYLSQFPDYTSVKNMFHWKQISQTGEFKYFDYGPENIIIYNQPTPPFYKIEEITVPIAVWSGGQDLVSQPVEISQLLARIRSLVYAEEFPDWNHYDHIWGIDAHQRMYGKVLALMEK